MGDTNRDRGSRESEAKLTIALTVFGLQTGGWMRGGFKCERRRMMGRDFCMRGRERDAWVKMG